MKTKNEKKITLKIVSDRGHDTIQLSPALALNRVRTETAENGKWCYVDGNFASADSLGVSDIEKAEEIVLVNSLLGG